MTKDEALAVIAAQPETVARVAKVAKVGSFGKKAPKEGGVMLFLSRPESYKLTIPGTFPAAVHSDRVREAIAGKALPATMNPYARETLLAAVKARKDDVIVLLGEALSYLAAAAKA